MNKRTNSLIFKFGCMFLTFLVVAILMNGINAYLNERDIYRTQCEVVLKNIAEHCQHALQTHDVEFRAFQEYFLKNHKNMQIEKNFTDFKDDLKNFQKAFHERYPGRTLHVDLSFQDMDDDLKMLWACAIFKKWLLFFERTRDIFGLKYTCYLVPSGEAEHMIWLLDAMRDPSPIHGSDYLNLGIDVHEPLDEHEKMWAAWSTGKSAEGYDVYDNEYGQTYAYYVPLIIDGAKLGVIGTEIEIAKVDTAILKNTLLQLTGQVIILILCVLVLLFVIYRKYILKLENLQKDVRVYTQEKDARIIRKIEGNATGGDEISSLSMEISAMILELENYMQRLKETTLALGKEKERAEALKELASKDALTGIRNKSAYDKETKRLAWNIEEKTAHFAIMIIDLNFLKRVNDTYGHEHGNTMIRTLCHLICSVFKHSPVFRIGGDEFAVILENEDLGNLRELILTFNKKLEEIAQDQSLEPWERVSAAVGLAIFDPQKDVSVENVFKRADKAMYTRKKLMKAVRED